MAFKTNFDQDNQGLALFKKAKLAEKQGEWFEAYELYVKAEKSFKDRTNSSNSDELFNEENILYILRAKINSLLNMFRFNYEESDEFNVLKAVELIKIYQAGRRHLLNQHFNIYRRYYSKSKGC